jgi:hypothetical protein
MENEMRKAILNILLSLILIGCCEKTKNVCLSKPKDEKVTKNANITKEMLDSIPSWPKCSLQGVNTTSLDDNFRIRWYNSHLHAMDEPLLGFEIQCNECYRFLWLRTFDNPILVCFFDGLKGKSIRWKILDGAGGYDPGKIMTSKERVLSIEEWNRIEEIIDDMEFWRLYTENKYYIGMDGAQWIIEGKCEKNYHIVDRWSPKKSNSFRQGCLKLLAFTDIEIPEDEIY